jgi:putative ABC transport system permease protein
VRYRRLFHLRLWRPALDDGIDWEIRHHLEERMDELRARGMSEAEAEREARRMFGDEARVRRSLRRIDRELRAHERVALWFGTLGQDVRYGVRSIVRNPGFAAALVLTMALGIGANGALFSVADALLLRPLPYAASHELVQLQQRQPQNDWGQPYQTTDFARAWQEHQTVFTSVLVHTRRGGVAFDDGPEPMRAVVEGVGATFHETLGVQPRFGRGFGAEDVRAGAPHVALVSWDFWTTTLGADEAVIGRDLVLNGVPARVVGVMPRGFKFPEYSQTDVWVPLSEEMTVLGGPARMMYVVGRLPGGDLAAVQSAIAAQGAAVQRAVSPGRELIFYGSRMEDERARGEGVRPAMKLLAVAMLLILLVAGVNMVNLLLLRGAARTREIAVRLSLGASRRRVVRQLATEAMLLALISGVVATVLAFVGLRALQAMMPSAIVFYAPHAIEVETRTLLFTFALAVGCGLLFGLLPALRATKLAAEAAGGSLLPHASAHAGGSPRLRQALVTSEVAIAVTLLVGAGLLINSFIRLTRVDPGLEIERLAVLELTVSSRHFPEPGERADYLLRLEQRIAGLPGVTGVTITGGIPPRGGGISFTQGLVPEGAAPREEDVVLPHSTVRSDFFDVTGTRLLAGRAFEPNETAASGSVIVTQALAHYLWPGSDAVGRRFRMSESSDWLTVVGVASELKLMGPAEPRARFALLYPLGSHEDVFGAVIVVRAAGDPRTLLQPLRAAVHAVNPTQIIDELDTARSLYATSLDMQRFLYVILTTLAVLALTLSAIGIYGLLAYSVARRQREIGVRMALGARRLDVRRLIVGEAMIATAAGAALGVAGAFATARFIRAALFGVEPVDPVTFAVVLAVVLVTALLAAALPTRRATAVDPAVVLRGD